MRDSSERRRRDNDSMTISIHKHEAVPDCGSFEVRYSDGRESVFFYFEENPGRRLRPEQVNRETALQAAKTFAISERDKPKDAR